MKNYIYILAAMILFQACHKEGMTTYTATVKNQAPVGIEIVPFINEKPVIDKIIDLQSQENIVVGNKPERGITNNSGLQSDYYSTADYVAVVFNGSDSVFHYAKQNASQYPSRKKYYVYEDARNLLNMNSYDYSYEDISSRRREAQYIYTFTAADYEFSKP